MNGVFGEIAAASASRALPSSVPAAGYRAWDLASHSVRFVIDDFGTGYSSLAYLNRLAID